MNASSKEDIDHAVATLSESLVVHSIGSLNLPEFAKHSSGALTSHKYRSRTSTSRNHLVAVLAILGMLTIGALYVTLANLLLGIVLFTSIWVGYSALVSLSFLCKQQWGRIKQQFADEIHQLYKEYWSLLVQYARRAHATRLAHGLRPAPYTELDQWTIGIVTQSKTTFVRLSQLIQFFREQVQVATNSSKPASIDEMVSLQYLSLFPRVVTFEGGIKRYRKAYQEAQRHFNDLESVITKEGSVIEGVWQELHLLENRIKSLISEFCEESRYTGWHPQVFFDLTDLILGIQTTRSEFQPRIYENWRAVCNIYKQIITWEKGVVRIHKEITDTTQLRAQAQGLDIQAEKLLDEAEILVVGIASEHALHLDEYLSQVRTWRTILTSIKQSQSSQRIYRRLIEYVGTLQRDVPLLQTQIHRLISLQTEIEGTSQKIGLIFDQTKPQVLNTREAVVRLQLTARPYTEDELLTIHKAVHQAQRDGLKLTEQYVYAVDAFEKVSDVDTLTICLKELEKRIKKHKSKLTEEPQTLDDFSSIIAQVEHLTPQHIRVQSNLRAALTEYNSARTFYFAAIQDLYNYVETELDYHKERVSRIRKELKGWKYISRRQELRTIETSIKSSENVWKTVERTVVSMENITALEKAIQKVQQLSSVERQFVSEALYIIDQYLQARHQMKKVLSKRRSNSIDKEVRKNLSDISANLDALKNKEEYSIITSIINQAISASMLIMNSASNTAVVHGQARGFAVGPGSTVTNLFGDSSRLDRLQLFHLGEQVLTMCMITDTAKAQEILDSLIKAVGRTDVENAFTLSSMQQLLRTEGPYKTITELLDWVSEARETTLSHIKPKLRQPQVNFFCIGFDLRFALSLTQTVSKPVIAQTAIADALRRAVEATERVKLSTRQLEGALQGVESQLLGKQELLHTLEQAHTDLTQRLARRQRTTRSG